MDTGREEEGGTNGESRTDINTPPCVRQTGDGKLLNCTGLSAG